MIRGGFHMATHRRLGNGSAGSRKAGHPWLATAVAIGGAGIALAAPGAALLATPAVAQAAPLPAVDPLCSLLGSCSSGGLGASVAHNLADPFGLPTDLMGFAGGIPVLNIFIGNGADGTALHPDGFNGGLFFGNGGKGFSPTTPGANAGNGGNAGMFIGSGGAGGAGGAGGTGGTGGTGVNPTTTNTAAAGTGNGGNGVNGFGFQN